jgi:hypothetical protein
MPAQNLVRRVDAPQSPVELIAKDRLDESKLDEARHHGCRFPAFRSPERDDRTRASAPYADSLRIGESNIADIGRRLHNQGVLGRYDRGLALRCLPSAASAGRLHLTAISAKIAS